MADTFPLRRFVCLLRLANSRKAACVVFLLAAVSALAPAAPAAEPAVVRSPGYLTWGEAVARNHPIVAQFRKPEGVPVCPPPEAQKPVPPAEPPPSDGPVCFLRPEDQGLLIPDTPDGKPIEGSDPLSAPPPAPEGEAGGLFGYRFVGSQTNSSLHNFERALFTAEASDPSVCNGPTPPCPVEHFYSRSAAITPAGYAMEIGWVESNHNPIYTAGGQVVLTTAYTSVSSQTYTPLLHTNLIMSPGSENSFRLGQCAGPGVYHVCWEFWNGSAWATIRQWLGAMRCELPTGDANCRFNWLDEVFSSDLTFPALNGGSDGLRTRNIQVRPAGDNWFMFDAGLGFSGSWSLGDPYSLCPVATWYHFRVYQGSGFC